MEEVWKNIKESNNYFISNQGRFKNNNKILKLNKNKNGYLYCNISIKGRISKVKIHRLVAITFIDNPLNKETVNHIDGNKLNNVYTNLEWLTRKENNVHAIKLGLRNPKEDALRSWKKRKKLINKL